MRRRRQQNRWLVFLAGVTIWGCLAALCQSVPAASYVAEIIGINGQVEARAGSRPFAPAALMQRLFPPDAVRTLAAAKAKLSFIDQSILVLGQNTTVAISQYRLGAGETQPARTLKVITGKARFIVYKFFGSGDAEYSIDTPTLGVGIRGTDVIIASLGNTDTVYLLQAGAPLALKSKSTGEVVALKPGFFAISQAGRPIRIFPLTDDLRRQLLRELNLAFEVRPLGVPIEPELPTDQSKKLSPGVGPTQALPPVYTPPVPTAPAAPHPTP